MKLNRAILIFTLLFLFGRLGWAEDKDFLLTPAYDIKVPALAPGVRAGVGDLLHAQISGLSLRSEERAGVELGFPAGTEMVKEDWLLDLKSGEAEGWLELTLVPLKPGLLKIPPLIIKNAQGQAIARTNGFELAVASAFQGKDPKEAQPPSVLGPLGLAFPRKWIIIFSAVTFFLGLGLLVLLWRVLRKRFMKPPEPVVVAPKSADLVAIECLHQLQLKKLWEKGQHKKHYFTVSETLKEYFELRYGVAALESTTSEMLTELKRGGVHQNTLGEIERFFYQLDQVKFTDYVPVGGEAEPLVNGAVEIVRKTRRP